jgi:hypothetical protein
MMLLGCAIYPKLALPDIRRCMAGCGQGGDFAGVTGGDEYLEARDSAEP